MVKRLALLFPGQGSQYVGMAKAAFDKSSSAQVLMKKANDLLGYDIQKIMFEGPEEKLKDTSVTQPALFLASAMAWELLKDHDITHFDFAAGHSLGEYSALYAAYALTFEDGLTLVQERGKTMNEAGQQWPGTMAAIIGLPAKEVTELCDIVTKSVGICVPANINSDTQIVISGAKKAIEKALELAKEKGALKAIVLNVSGAFHSPLMSSAARTMENVIKNISISDAAVPVLTNVDAHATTNAGDIKKKLVQQIDHAVQWQQTMIRLVELQVETFIEVGAGRVLSNLMKKFDRKKAVFCTDDFEAIEKNLIISSAQ